jgi:uncharacterized protein (DUF433 family)
MRWIGRRRNAGRFGSRSFRRKTMLDHIVSNPAILSGKPCIKGTRISAEFILELAASGASRDDIVKAYAHLTTEDVEQALRYGMESLKPQSLT